MSYNYRHPAMLIRPVKWISIFQWALIITFFFTGCQKAPESDSKLPVVSTSAISSITVSSAESGGDVTNQGISPVSVRGICYGTTQNPTISGTTVQSGSGAGTFTATLSGLLPNTTYYVRAFATNSAGTGYGTQTTFTTVSGPPPVPLDTAEVLYIGGSTKLYAFNARNGVLKWTVNLGADVQSSPAYANGKVYVGCQDKKLYCYDTSGNFKWSALTDGIIEAQSPVVYYGNVYIVNNTGRVYAYNANSGAPVWQYATGNPAVSSLVIKNNTVYLQANNTYALNAITGALRWFYYTNGASAPAIFNNKLYVVASTGSICICDATTGALKLQKFDASSLGNAAAVNIANGRIYCARKQSGFSVLDTSTATMLFNVSNNNNVLGEQPYGSGVVPLVIDNIAYLPCTTGVYAYDASNGTFLWQSPADEQVSTVTIVNKVLYYGTRHAGINTGHVYAVDAVTHTIRWTTATSDDFNISAACVVTQSGVMYRYGYVY